MKRVFLVSQDFPGLALEEIRSLSSSVDVSGLGSFPKLRCFGSLAVSDAKFDFSRLALTRSVYSLLFSCRPSGLEKRMESFDWSSVYKGSFSLKVRNHGSLVSVPKESFLAGFIWRSVRSPKVDLRSAKTCVEVFFTRSLVFVCLLSHQLDQGFSGRLPKLLPAMHPTAISPKIARAMVNITSVPKGSVFTDPFCGAGGILIESALMGIRTVGSDILPDMLERARKNLDHFGLKAVLKKCDAVHAEHLDYVASDLPYGRSSSLNRGLFDLYLSFLENLKTSLGHRAVLIFPDFVDHKSLIRKAGLRIVFETSIYVHKSLSRSLVVLQR